MPTSRRRPFPTGGLVPSEDLVGREDAIRALVRRVYELKSSVYFSGPRQTGKTSVVSEALKRILKAGGRAVYVDCTGLVDVATFAVKLATVTYDAKGSAGAFARLRQTLTGVRPTVMHPDSGLAITFFGSQPPPAERRLEQALKLADELAVKDKKRTVVVFDEFPRLGELDDKIFDQVRSHLQHSVKNTAYIFMGSQVGMLRTLFTQRKNMLYRLASEFELPLPAETEWVRYMEQRFRSWKKPLGQGEAARMVEITGGHPRDLMEICRALLDIRLAGGRARSSDLDLALEQAIATLDDVFDEIWKSLAEPAGTRVTAVRIATGGPPLWQGRPRRTVQLSLERLERDGLIRKSGRGRYVFTEKLFALWLHRHAPSSGAP